MRRFSLTVLVAVVSLAFAVAGRAQHRYPRESEPHRKQPVFCPVTKAKITDPSSASRLSVNRETVLLCCKSCIHKLKQTPAKYLNQLKDPVNGKSFIMTAKSPKIEKEGALYLFSTKETYAHGLAYLHGNGNRHGHGDPADAKAPKQHGAHHAGHGGHDAHPAKEALVKVGQAVPDFTLTDLSGATLKLSELQNKTPSGAVTLTYWCSFCHSCRGVEKRLEQFARQQREKAAVVLIDASAGETPERVSEFAKKTGLTLPILLDNGGKSVDLFGIHATTTTLVIDAKGILRYRGQFKQAEQEPAVRALQAVLDGKEVPQKETPQRG